MLLQSLEKEVALKAPRRRYQPQSGNRRARQDGKVREGPKIGGAM